MATTDAQAPGGAAQETSLFGRYFLRYTDEFYLLFRLIFAFIVGLHGAQKAFCSGDFRRLIPWARGLTSPGGLRLSPP